MKGRLTQHNQGAITNLQRPGGLIVPNRRQPVKIWDAVWTIGRIDTGTIYGYGTGAAWIGGALVPAAIGDQVIVTLRDRDETLAPGNQVQLQTVTGNKINGYDVLTLVISDWDPAPVSVQLVWSLTLLRYLWDHDQVFTDQIKANLGSSFQVSIFGGAT